jgi:hypothetical protein
MRADWPGVLYLDGVHKAGRIRAADIICGWSVWEDDKKIRRRGNLSLVAPERH